MEKRLVLVTGGLGYVGTVLVPLLAQRWPVRVYDSMMFGNAIAGTPNVEFIQGDMRDWLKLKEAMGAVTDVVHLAGIVTDELVAMNPDLARKVNEWGTDLLCRAAFQSGTVRRLIYASSSSIYGTQTEGVEASEETAPLPLSEYARQKLDGERACLRYASDTFTVTCVRAATASGPAPRMRLDTIVNIFCQQAYFQGNITVHGGDQWRNNIHVRDMAGFYALLLGAPEGLIHGQVFNISAGNHTAVELAEMVAQIIPAQVLVDCSKKDNRHYRMQCEKAKRVLGWQPQFALEDAIRDNLAFFQKGGVPDPLDSVYFNNKRMATFMRSEN